MRNEREENENEKSDICARRKLAKRVYMYILSQHYHFDRQWKELEKPNASFEGRTTHPIIRSVDNHNTTAQINLLFKIFLFSYGRRFLTHSIIAKTHTHTHN